MQLSFLIILIYMSAILYNGSSYIKNCINSENIFPMTSDSINIKIGSQTFKATLLDHPSAKALKKMLPITIVMTDLNGNEKYGDLLKSLPINTEYPKTIKNGDLMLYGSQTLVLFYKTFHTSYSYTRIGFVNDVTGLAAALGSENISITFDAE